jgi:hypothetical protein
VALLAPRQFHQLIRDPSKYKPQMYMSSAASATVSQVGHHPITASSVPASGAGRLDGTICESLW